MAYVTEDKRGKPMPNDEQIALRHAIADIECPHKDAGSLAATVEHHWPTIKAALAKLEKLEAEAAAMRGAIMGLLEDHSCEPESRYISRLSDNADKAAKAALFPDAGEKVLDVVRAAKGVLKLRAGYRSYLAANRITGWQNDEVPFEVLEKALSALGWKP